MSQQPLDGFIKKKDILYIDGPWMTYPHFVISHTFPLAPHLTFMDLSETSQHPEL